MFKWFTLIALIITSGCTTTTSRSFNYIDPTITSSDAQIISSDFALYIKDTLAPATTTIRIEENLTDNKFAPIFIDTLQKAGYAVEYQAQTKDEAASSSIVLTNKIKLSYKLMPLEQGIVLVAKINNTEISRYFSRSSGSLIASAPYSIRQNEGASND